MLLLAFLVLLETTLAADPAHIKPETLLPNLERAFLVEDVLWVRYPFPTLVEVSGHDRAVRCRSVAAREQLPLRSGTICSLPSSFACAGDYLSDTRLLWTFIRALTWLTVLNGVL